MNGLENKVDAGVMWYCFIDRVMQLSMNSIMILYYMACLAELMMGNFSCCYLSSDGFM